MRKHKPLLAAAEGRASVGAGWIDPSNRTVAAGGRRYALPDRVRAALGYADEIDGVRRHRSLVEWILGR
jgi:hypothetical protein